MTLLKSSNLASADYNDELGEMVIEFNNGGVYAYKAPREAYEGLISAASPGKFFQSTIRNAGYPYRKL